MCLKRDFFFPSLSVPRRRIVWPTARTSWTRLRSSSFNTRRATSTATMSSDSKVKMRSKKCFLLLSKSSEKLIQTLIFPKLHMKGKYYLKETPFLAWECLSLADNIAVVHDFIKKNLQGRFFKVPPPALPISMYVTSTCLQLCTYIYATNVRKYLLVSVQPCILHMYTYI